MRDSLDIDRIAFFGRTYREYLDMFGLNEDVLRKGRILDCPAGASSFTVEARAKGINATATDILYGLDADTLLQKGRKDIGHVFEKFDEVAHLYVWNYYKSKDEVMAVRTKALELFTADFSAGKEEDRYVRAELPHLSFPDKAFDVVLSSNFLFLYGDRLDLDFHKASLMELLRVCSGEVRLFPLIGLDFKPYPYLDDVVEFLHNEGVMVETIGVPFEFQKGANRVLRLRNGQGKV
ncbi:MAG: SAM-dependent methyltransferase [Nitrospirae bacterium]|nr:MAG: SAM-dependent methyltransferase [Nitrospirota bacterium]